MFNISQIKNVPTATDLSLAQEVLGSIRWSYGDVKFLGAAFAAPISIPNPTSSPAIEVMRTKVPTGGAYMLTGSMTLTDESVASCLVIAGAPVGELSFTNTLKANLDRLARVLGYTATVDGVETPLWVCSYPAPLTEDPAETRLTLKKLDINGSFSSTTSSNVMYVSTSNFVIADNRTRYIPTFEPQALTVSDDVCLYGSYQGMIFYMSEKQYLTDMQNVQDLTNLVLIAMGNPSETTELTARVSAIETAITTQVSQPTADAISDAVSAEASARAAAVSAETAERAASISSLAIAVSNIPVFGARLVDVANAASTVKEYVPRS